MKTQLILKIAAAAMAVSLPLPSFSQATSRIPGEILSCRLDTPLEIGAGITARTPEMFLGGYNNFMRWYVGDKERRIGGRRIYGSPSSMFLEHYGQGGLIAKYLYNSRWYDKSSFAGVGPIDPSSVQGRLYQSLGLNLDSSGAGQIAALLYGNNRRIFDKSTAIFAVDLMYWDAMTSRCDPEAERMAAALIDEAEARDKVLFIGTVPLEDPDKVPVNSEKTQVEGVWYPINHACARRINTVIRDKCEGSPECYIVDLEKMAETLNADQPLFVQSLGRSFFRKQMRPDGVHISEVGSKYVFEQMRDAFESRQHKRCGR